jgi:hypothetical protein
MLIESELAQKDRTNLRVQKKTDTVDVSIEIFSMSVLDTRKAITPARPFPPSVKLLIQAFPTS